MHKRIPKEMVEFIASVKCNISFLKDKVEIVQCCSFAGFFHEVNPIRVGCLKEKIP